MNWDEMRCIFGCRNPVIGLYYLSRGCAVKADKKQALCLQHYLSCEPIEGFRVVAERKVEWTPGASCSRNA